MEDGTNGHIEIFYRVDAAEFPGEPTHAEPTCGEKDAIEEEEEEDSLWDVDETDNMMGACPHDMCCIYIYIYIYIY